MREYWDKATMRRVEEEATTRGVVESVATRWSKKIVTTSSMNKPQARRQNDDITTYAISELGGEQEERQRRRPKSLPVYENIGEETYSKSLARNKTWVMFQL